MIDADDEFDLALNPDENVRVRDLEAPAPTMGGGVQDVADAAAPARGVVPGGPGLTPPGEIVPPEEMPPGEYGPPAPNPTGPPGGASEPWPPNVPPGAPGAVPPGGAPAALAGEGPAGGEPGSPEAIQGALDERSKARKEYDEAQQRQYEGQQTLTEEQAKYATERRAELEQRQKEDEARAQADAAADAKAKAEVAQKQQQLNNFKWKDVWADKTTGQKVATVIGSALLAIGAGMMKTPKYAMEIIDKDIADDHQKQLDNLNQLRDDYVMAHTGMQDAQLARQKIAADINLARARKDGLIASRFEEAAANAKVANAGNDAAAFAAKLRQDEAQANLDAQTAYRNIHLAQEKAELDKRLKESQIKSNEALASLRDRGLGQGRKTHGAGGGGGGANLNAAETKLANEIAARKAANNPMTEGEIYAFADNLHLPHTAKAGHPSVANVLAGAARMTSTAGAEHRFETMDDRQFLAKQKNFEQQNNTAGLTKMVQKFHEAREMLKAGNGMGAMSALMEADGAARGAQATESSMRALEAHSGGLWDKFRGWVAKGESGNFGEEQKKNIAEMIDAGEKGARSAREDLRAQFHASLGDDERAKKAAIGIFGEPGSSPAAGRPHDLPVGARKQLSNGTWVEKKGPNNWQPVAP